MKTEKDGSRIEALFEVVGAVEGKRVRRGRKGTGSRQGVEGGGSESGCVLYVGHIPHGFYEEEMKKFFSQFGEVRRVRLSRSRKTGKTRGYGFLEFLSPKVAAIAAETMDRYMFFGRLLDVHVVDAQKVHPDTFRNSDQQFRKVDWSAVERAKRAKVKNPQRMKQTTRRRKMRELERRKLVIKRGLAVDSTTPPESEKA
uniref:RRM domain-containing protein n=1 Tax=Compsopogon caeruleus TaxID=31354 RepID=A0A7S1TBD4_9RHOD|mmetsp:Transcript_14819/g.30161  ORF Transcript_14819/g.30161 Transcript_14819/m.30161 type:complete len:199 (+) Transcript_14819:1381-1977(+)